MTDAAKQRKLNELVTGLRKLGVRVVGSRVAKAEFRKVFGARMTQPEWIVLRDYSDVTVPQNLVDYIQAELSSHGRAFLPTSMKYANFGEYLNSKGEPVALCAVVFQYSVENSPRNVCFGYKLFDQAKVVSENNGLATDSTAISQCMEAAKLIIETELYDL